MHAIDMPAGSAARLTATARPDTGFHRWKVGVFAARDAGIDDVSLSFDMLAGAR